MAADIEFKKLQNYCSNPGRNTAPTSRLKNPSPLAALDYLLRKVGRKDLDFPFTDAPWPLLTIHPISHFPTEECDWIWGRYEDAEPDNPEEYIDLNRDSKAGIATSWFRYSANYNRNKADSSVCRVSNWYKDSLPRIAEDGGSSARLSYLQVETLHAGVGRLRWSINPVDTQQRLRLIRSQTDYGTWISLGSLPVKYRHG